MTSRSPYGIRELCSGCRSSRLNHLLFLGYVPPVNMMPPQGIPHQPMPTFPLDLYICSNCALVQINYVVDPNILFPPEYPYTSGTTRVLRENFAELYGEARSLLNLKSSDFIIDIGSNDGTLLSNFCAAGHRVLGIEPTLMADKANARGIRTRMSFFSGEVGREVAQAEGLARLVTATNVFAHIDDVQGVMEGIRAMIGDTGVFVSESHYLLDLVQGVQYDAIYHEHIRYYSLTSLKYLLESAGLTVFRAKRIPTHAGSIRVYAAVNPPQVDASVANLLAEEEKAQIMKPEGFVKFLSRVRASKLELYGILGQAKKRGDRVYGVGCPSRASTLINYVGLDSGIIECIVEVSGSHKISKYVPGTDIPVDDEARLFSEQPEYALLFSWHIADEIIEKLRQRGFRGRFVVPLPSPRVVS